jgi:hypothetical protein
MRPEHKHSVSGTGTAVFCHRVVIDRLDRKYITNIRKIDLAQCDRAAFVILIFRQHWQSVFHQGAERRHAVSFGAGLSGTSHQNVYRNRIPQKTRRASMSEQDKTGGNESKNNMMTRRTTLTLAAAVATFGAAMGMRAPAAWAQGKMEGDSDERRNYDRDRDGERYRDYDRDRERRGEGKGEGKGESKGGR